MGQLLKLECSVITVRGITSQVDIVWSSNGEELKRINAVPVNFISEDAYVYTAPYNILQLSTDDDDRVFYCEEVINASSSVMAAGNVTLNVNGK